MKRIKTKCTFLLLLTMSCGYAYALDFNGFAGGGNYNVSVSSFLERRFKTVYKQKYDFSCGSAALASLLTFHYDDQVDEESVFMDMYKHGDQQKIQKQGFSLLDIKRFLERRGYQSDGFKIGLDQLILAHVPAITIINNNGYLHFIIIKGLNEHEVLVGDPAVGIKTIPYQQFVEMWGNRILFLIHDKQDVAAKHFQNDEEWALWVKAPLDDAFGRDGLGQFNLLQPGQWDFK